MKTSELNAEQLALTANNYPDWLSYYLPNWMADNRPEWMADNRPDWMAVNRPDWMAVNRPDWMADVDVPAFIIDFLKGV